MIFLQLFIIFFEIGLFGFGGGYGMLSLIQGEVVTKHAWLTAAEFTDIVAVSQVTPGPIGINSATYVGYAAVTHAGYSASWGMLGSCLATVAVVLPSFLLMLLVVKFFQKYRDNAIVESMFASLRPTVVGLIAAAAILLMTRENFSTLSESPWQFYISLFLFISTFIGTQYFKINPIRMILLCGLAGLLLYY
ncbi:MAG: chromate transporter [Bacteroidaceae bacterium]|nr:chromate transporter [Bacteroidaceae bacterium]